jgi:hypothetical protein
VISGREYLISQVTNSYIFKITMISAARKLLGAERAAFIRIPNKVLRFYFETQPSPYDNLKVFIWLANTPNFL